MATVRQIEIMRRERKVEEAAWTVIMRERLLLGSASTRQLADACGIKPGREFARFRRCIDQSGFIVRGGTTTGPTGHLNIVWRLS